MNMVPRIDPKHLHILPEIKSETDYLLGSFGLFSPDSCPPVLAAGLRS